MIRSLHTLNLSTDEKYLCLASDSGITIYNASTFDLCQEIRNLGPIQEAIQYKSTDLIVVLTCKQEVYVYNKKTNQILVESTYNETPIQIKVFDNHYGVRTGTKLYIYSFEGITYYNENHTAHFQLIDNQLLYVPNNVSRYLLVSTLNRSNVDRIIDLDNYPLRIMVKSKDNKTLALASEEGVNIDLIEVFTLKPVPDLKLIRGLGQDVIQSINFSPSDQLLCVCGSRTAHIFSLTPVRSNQTSKFRFLTSIFKRDLLSSSWSCLQINITDLNPPLLCYFEETHEKKHEEMIVFIDAEGQVKKYLLFVTPTPQLVHTCRLRV